VYPENSTESLFSTSFSIDKAKSVKDSKDFSFILTNSLIILLA
jgi:hypothetical protein